MGYGNYPDLSGVKRILVIKLRHLGDVLLTSPVFSHLKKKLPHAEIEALIYKETFPLLEGHPAISHFLFWERQWKTLPFHKKLFRELRLWKEIYDRKYDLVINLTEGDRGALAALVSRSPYRVGFDPADKGFMFKEKIYTHLVKNCSKPRHAVEKNLDALRRIGIFPKPEERDLFLHVPDSAIKNIKKFLQEANVVPGDYLVIHPVSRWLFKCPPAEKIAEVIQRLDALGYKVVLTSGPDRNECNRLERIEELCAPISILNLGGKISVKELAALIRMSRALICVDSVPLHIASALKTPLVALFGPTSEVNWGPWMHPSYRVIAHPISCRPCLLDGCGGSKMSDCLYALSVDAIVGAVQELICKIFQQEKI